jgi:chromosome segregation ATPase
MLFYTKRYKLLLEQVDAAERSIADVREQQRQVHEALAHQQTQYEQDIATLRKTFTSQITQMREIVDLQHSRHESLVALLNDSQHQLDRLRDDLTATLAHQQGQTHHRFQELETTLTEHGQAVEQMRDLLSTQTERQADTYREQRKEIEVLLARHSRDVGDALQGVKQEVVAFNQRFEKTEVNLEQLATNVEALKSTALAWQQKADTQEQQIAALRTQLQEEVQARKALAQQVATFTARQATKQPRKPQV